MTMDAPVTVLDLARYRLGRATNDDGPMTGADFLRAQLPIMGGCQVCHATVAAYNACPTRTGYLRCADGCVDAMGFTTVEEADADLFGTPARMCEIPYSEAAMHTGLAGKRLRVEEEVRYANGGRIPPAQRLGCYAITADGARVPLVKSEAGWDAGEPIDADDDAPVVA
jgi:hypothetical protein